jgi:hypothetical protein
MSKKQLNEVRRFMRLANLNGNITSNFIKETYGADYMREDEDVEDVGVEEEPEMAGLEDDIMGLEDDIMGLEDEEGAIEDEIGGLEAEESVGAEDLVLSIVNDIQQLASLAGVDVDVEGDEAVEDEMDMEMDLEMGPDDEMDIEGDIELDTEEPEEETLEEMINAILAEEDGAEAGDEKKTSGRKRGSKRGDEAYINEEEEDLEEGAMIDALKDRMPGAKARRQKKAADAQDDEYAAGLPDEPYDPNEPRGPGLRGAKRPARAGRPVKGVTSQNESVQVLDDDKLLREVTKRVKKRLVKIARAQRQKRTQKRRR